jgi:hypothetical protein
MDDIMVKSRKADQLVSNLEDTFARLQGYNIRLNQGNVFSG